MIDFENSQIYNRKSLTKSVYFHSKLSTFIKIGEFDI